MARLRIFLLLLVIPCVAHCLYTNFAGQKVFVLNKKFLCSFHLVHSDTEVEIVHSRLRCFPKYPKRVTVRVDLTSENYVFFGKIKINPTRIVSMNIRKLATTTKTTTTTTTTTTSTTTEMQETTTQCNQTSGNEEGEFEEMYKKVSSDIRPEYSHQCGIQQVEEYMERVMGKSYTSISDVKFWSNGEVPWSFVSTKGHDYEKKAVHTDDKVGLSYEDFDTITAAMKQIEARTCIRFKYKRRVKLFKGLPWLFILRDSRSTKNSCQRNYIKQNLTGNDIITEENKNLGDIYMKPGIEAEIKKECFRGAYAIYGSDSPQVLVIGEVDLHPNNQNDIGFIVHELLHNLGLGHTHKRRDAQEHIEIKWENIEKRHRPQYERCTGMHCSLYNDYNTKYDCMSIMHYRDKTFRTEDAANNGGKTMVAKKAGCDLSSSNYILTDADVEILNKIYCVNSPLLPVVVSTNYPQDYTDNEDKEYPITVDEGHVVKITFTDFDIEYETACNYDWVQVLDGDDTVLLDKKCGTVKPDDITSKTNNVKIKFHSDGSVTRKGFRAEYKAVKPTPPPLNGEWSDWSKFGPCSNQKDGKSPCYRKRFRDCNNPPPQHGGADCPGSNQERDRRPCRLRSTTDPSHPDCVIVGGWTPWSPWPTSGCNSDCLRYRTRTCTKPRPFNAKECAGSDTESSGCTGGDCPTTSSSNTITSPNYPYNYNDNELITTPIQGPRRYKIELSFTAFDVEYYPINCYYDYLKVIDSDDITVLAKLCGNSLPSPIKSSGSKMTLVFYSDHSVPKTGFKASWKYVRY